MTRMQRRRLAYPDQSNCNHSMLSKQITYIFFIYNGCQFEYLFIRFSIAVRRESIDCAIHLKCHMHQSNTNLLIELCIRVASSRRARLRQKNFTNAGINAM